MYLDRLDELLDLLLSADCSIHHAHPTNLSLDGHHVNPADLVIPSKSHASGYRFLFFPSSTSLYLLNLVMLRELHITNLAIIEDLTVELVPGLNVFTGETGAGKSLIIGAFETLLGLRPTAEAVAMIREGQAEARIAGLFEVHDPATAAEAAQLLDQDVPVGEPMLITRKLFASGRSSTSVNGQPATAPMVKAVAELLVDIHGQHDHQYLLRPSHQLHVLDAFARSEPLRERFGRLYATLRELRQRKTELDASATLREQQLALYKFQAEEIDAAEPTEGEFPELMARNRVLSNLQTIQQQAAHAHAALYEAEGSICERLQAVTQVLLDLAELDKGLSDVAEQVRTATLTLQETSYELDRYTRRLDLDPQEAGEVQDRLNTLHRLIQKYARNPRAASIEEDPLAEVIAYRERIGEELQTLEEQAAGQGGIDTQIEKLQRELAAVGAELTAQRSAAGEALRPRVEAELKDLGMPEAKLRIALASVDAASEEVSPTGLDAVEFEVQTNPGQGFRPLRKIASGGELSRVMLALKSILAGSDRISVLVFDEIDANIGGRLGSVIGSKLRRLAGSRGPGIGDPGSGASGDHSDHASALSGSGTTDGQRRKSRERTGTKTDPRSPTPEPRCSHQVLCITHLPQIAAFGDRHFRIMKSVTGSGKSRSTRTTVAPLDGDVRVDELAEMMAGKHLTDTSRQQAKELLATAGA